MSAYSTAGHLGYREPERDATPEFRPRVEAQFRSPPPPRTIPYRLGENQLTWSFNGHSTATCGPEQWLAEPSRCLAQSPDLREQLLDVVGGVPMKSTMASSRSSGEPILVFFR
jgi:hypothetical protein